MSDTLGSRFNFAFAMTTTVRVSILAGFSLGDLRPQLRSLAPVLLPTTDVAAVLISLIINYTISWFIFDSLNYLNFTNYVRPNHVDSHLHNSLNLHNLRNWLMSTAATGPLRCPITDLTIISFTVLTRNQFNFNHFSTLWLFPPPVLNRESYASVLHLATQVSISLSSIASCCFLATVTESWNLLIMVHGCW